MLKSPMKFVIGNEANLNLLATPVDGEPIPTMDNGVRPKFVHVCHDGAGAGEVVRLGFGDSNVAVTAGTGTIIAPNEACIFDVSGFTHFAAIGVGAGIAFSMTPLENF